LNLPQTAGRSDDSSLP